MERQGENIIHLRWGNRFDTRSASRRRHPGHPGGKDALHPQPGPDELREAIAEDYRKRYKVAVTRIRSW